MPVPSHLVAAPFTVSQARAAGLSADVLQGARFRRVFKGVYADVGIAGKPGTRIAAALLIAPPGSYASLDSAGCLWQLPRLTRSVEHRPQIGVLPGVRKPTTAGIDWLRFGRRPALVLIDGLWATDPVSTFVHVAVRRRLLDAVIIGDALVRRGLTTPERLVVAAAKVAGRAGLRASRAAAFVRPRVDSPMETLLRLLIVLAGLPEPVTNLDAWSSGGYRLARPDLSWPGVKVSVEYDGIHHFADADGSQRRSDNRRRTRMLEEGWVEVVVMSEDVFEHAWRLLGRIRDVLAARGLPGVPERLNPAWRQVLAQWRR